MSKDIKQESKNQTERNARDPKGIQKGFKRGQKGNKRQPNEAKATLGTSKRASLHQYQNGVAQYEWLRDCACSCAKP